MNKVQKLNLVIIEDITEIREYYCSYFKQQEEFVNVSGYNGMESYFEEADGMGMPDIILSDINLTGMSGIEGIIKIKDKWPEALILMLTVVDNSNKIFKSLCAGAIGYAIKDTPLPELKKAVLDVVAGGSYMSPSIARKVLEYFAPSQKINDPLTIKERQIIQGLVDGLSYKMIADRVSLSHDTVRYYVKKIYRKLQINTKIELIDKHHKGYFDA